MERIGIFGGTFNPIHNEHINLIKSAVVELNLDKLIVVPDNIPPHKEADLPSNEVRLNMLKIALSNIDKVEISDVELKRKGVSYTYLTLEHFKSEYPNCQLFFICGADMLYDFPTWKNPKRILELVSLVSAEREGDEKIEDFRKTFKNTFNKDFISLKFKGKKISSTLIRASIGLGLSVSEYLPQNLIEYLVKNNVYGDKYYDYIKENLPEKRKIHTLGVICTALKKAKELNLPINKVRISALLHDNAKYLNYLDYPDFKLDDGVPKPVIHAFLGEYIARVKLKITDSDILNAIKYHTSGRSNMSDLEKLIFVADMIEDNRVYEGVEILREAFNKDFNEGFKTCLKEEMKHLLAKEKDIYIKTIEAYNFYCK